MQDRGQLALGLRADLIRVRMRGEMPIVRMPGAKVFGRFECGGKLREGRSGTDLRQC